MIILFYREKKHKHDRLFRLLTSGLKKVVVAMKMHVIYDRLKKGSQN